MVARARNIKPGFYKNEDLAECSIWARYIFPGLWMLADREGRLEDRPKRIKAELLPFDGQDAEPLLSELDRRGLIVRYMNSDGSFIQIPGFFRHQSPHHTEKASVIKPPSLQESNGKMGDRKGLPLQRLTEPLPPDSLNPSSLNPDSTTRLAPTGAPPAPIEVIPIKGGEFPVEQSFVAELDRAYPAVDVPQTLKEIRAWMVANPDRQKTRRGIGKCINSWCAREQEKHGRQAQVR